MKKWKKTLAIALCVSMLGSVALAETAMNGPQNPFSSQAPDGQAFEQQDAFGMTPPDQQGQNSAFGQMMPGMSGQNSPFGQAMPGGQDQQNGNVQNAPSMPEMPDQQDRNDPFGQAMLGGQDQQNGNVQNAPSMPEMPDRQDADSPFGQAMPGGQDQQNGNAQNAPSMPEMPDRQDADSPFGRTMQDDQDQMDQNGMLPEMQSREDDRPISNRMMTVQTGNNGKLNMREEPRTGAKLVDQYANGTQVEVLEVDGEWVKVRINGRTGYMMVKFLEGDLTEDTDEELPELPDDMNSERPELPEGAEGEEPPEKPDGDMNGEPPAMPDGEMNAEPPAMPDGGMNGTPGFPGGPGAENAPTDYSAASTLTESSTGASYVSSADSENAVLVSQGNVTLSGSTVSKTGSAGNESADFYGINAAVLATGGATLTVEDATVTSDGSHANGIFSYGSGTTVNVFNTDITTDGNNSGGLMTTGGATLNATNVNVSTAGNSSAAIRSDRGGGTVNVSGGSYATGGVGSPAIYSTADITVSDAVLSASSSEAVVIEGGNSVTLNNVSVTGSNSKLNGQSTVNTNVLIYQSMSGDAAEGDSSFTMTGGSMTAGTGAMFHVTNTATTITLENVDFSYAADSNVFLDASADAWGKSGSNGGNVTLNLVSQDITGAILCDSVSGVTLSLDDDSTWTLTGNSYLMGFSGDLSRVDLNGYTLYINGVAVQ